MEIEATIIALIWGVLSGFLLLRIVESLLAGLICLQGLLASRWKRLVNKASPGQIKYTVILHTLLRVACFGVLFGLLYQTGDTVARREFGFGGVASNETVRLICAGLVASICVRGSWRRLIMVWKMTHVFDFAEKRRRTFLLRKNS